MCYSILKYDTRIHEKAKVIPGVNSNLSDGNNLE